MCKAFEEMRLEGFEEGIEQGIEQGIERGIEQGARLMGKLSLCLAKDGRVEEISRAAIDASYRNQLLCSMVCFQSKNLCRSRCFLKFRPADNG